MFFADILSSFVSFYQVAIALNLAPSLSIGILDSYSSFLGSFTSTKKRKFEKESSHVISYVLKQKSDTVSNLRTVFSANPVLLEHAEDQLLEDKEVLKFKIELLKGEFYSILEQELPIHNQKVKNDSPILKASLFVTSCYIIVLILFPAINDLLLNSTCNNHIAKFIGFLSMMYLVFQYLILTSKEINPINETIWFFLVSIVFSTVCCCTNVVACCEEGCSLLLMQVLLLITLLLSIFPFIAFTIRYTIWMSQFEAKVDSVFLEACDSFNIERSLFNPSFSTKYFTQRNIHVYNVVLFLKKRFNRV